MVKEVDWHSLFDKILILFGLFIAYQLLLKIFE